METLIPYIITILVAAIPGFIALVASRRMNVADVAAKYQALAAKQADDNAKLERCQDELEVQINELKAALRLKDNEIAILKARVTELESENAQLKSEIEKLRMRRK